MLRRARETLMLAQRGADDVGGHPASRVAGITNVAVFGRSVSFVLQTLRSVDEKQFDAWYQPWQTEMKADPLLRYFNDLRTEILKEGLPPISASIHIESLTGAEIQRMQSTGPPGYTQMFIGEGSTGGSGWIVPMPDGSTEKYYMKLPDDIRITTALHLPSSPPAEHLGAALTDTSAANLCRLYVDYMVRLLDDANREFSEI